VFGGPVECKREEGGVTWIWWAPLGAATLHIIEEFVYPGGFADWDRSYRPEISASITPRFHLVINALLLVLCAQVWELAPLDQTELRWAAGAAWLAVAGLLFSNAVFHVVGTIRTKSRSPGVITAVLIYVPLALYGYWWFLTTERVPPLTALTAAALGGSYPYWARLIHRARAGRPTRVSGRLRQEDGESGG
jgi:hypothetical protein